MDFLICLYVYFYIYFRDGIILLGAGFDSEVDSVVHYAVGMSIHI